MSQAGAIFRLKKWPDIFNFSPKFIVASNFNILFRCRSYGKEKCLIGLKIQNWIKSKNCRKSENNSFPYFSQKLLFRIKLRYIKTILLKTILFAKTLSLSNKLKYFISEVMGQKSLSVQNWVKPSAFFFKMLLKVRKNSYLFRWSSTVSHNFIL